MARADTINAPRGGKRLAARARAAIGYVRRSTDRQEQSIPDQKKAIEKYSDENDLRLLRFYVDDAISGTSTVGRRAFQDMIADAKRRSCDFRFVVVYDVKRFGRVDNDEAGYYRHSHPAMARSSILIGIVSMVASLASQNRRTSPQIGLIATH